MTLPVMFQSRNWCLETYEVKLIQKKILKSVILDLRAQCKLNFKLLFFIYSESCYSGEEYGI